MTQTQTTEKLPIENQTVYDRNLLKRSLKNLVLYKFGQKKPLKKNSGDTVNFRKFNSLKPAITPLTEGVTPAGNKIDITSVEAKCEQYGDFIEVSDKLDMVGIDPVITETTEVLGEQSAETIDTVIGDKMVTTTNVFFANSVSNRDSVTGKATGTDIKKIVRNLKSANIKPFEDGFYIGIISPEQSYDLQEDSLFQDISKYSGGEAIKKGEIGKLHKVKFIETTDTPKRPKFAKTSDSDITAGKEYYTKENDGTYKLVESPERSSISNYYEVTGYVHIALIFGENAYGVVDIENSAQKPKIIVKEPGSAGSADPLNQRGTIGWKAMFTAVVLNDLGLCRYETAVSE